MCGKHITLALIFLGVVTPFCALGAAAAGVAQRNLAANHVPGGVADVAKRNLAANENPGFISIDCGATGGYLDEFNQIRYETDSEYIDSGETMKLSPEFMNNDTMLMGKTLRSFPDGKRNCYTLKRTKGENQTYLIRAYFLYGNYDGMSQIPIFDLYIGVNRWDTVQFANISSLVSYEINIIPPNEAVQVCLVNTGHGTPFINGLELRVLENSHYQPGPGALKIQWRYNIGPQQKSVRHPDDDYDRIWQPMSLDKYPAWLPISSEPIFNTSGTDDFYKVPDKVLMTAARSPNASIPLTWYTQLVDATTTTWHIYFHFAEIQQREDGQKRKVWVSVNNETTKAITLEYAKPMTLSLPLYGPIVNYSIHAVEGSPLPPILNAVELYNVTDLPNVATLLDDVDAMTSIKKKYTILKNWQGDPCVPKNFAWESINCSYNNPPRIILLNLSSCNLMGEISTAFSKLSGIQTLDLSYNGLSGPLPEFLGELPNLQILYLMGNNLAGPIPSSLKNKLQDGALTLRLAGNPICQTNHCEEIKKSTKQRSILPLVASNLSTAVIVVIICALVFLSRNRRREDAIKNSQDLIKSRNKSFKYSELLQITGNLKTIIGEGGFGKVYRGDLTNGTKVAVKLLSETSMQGHKEFQAEAQLLMIVHHKNLVSLIGYCHDGGNRALIYEYMANGNLRHHLSETTTKVLSWTQRLHVAVDAAQGLEYLHNGCKPPIIHRDLKPANILLDENMQAKIADFGMSRTFLTESATHVTTRVAGTIGYVDPEFQATGNFNKANDVYSFGIILFELITGRSAIIKGIEKIISIMDWVNLLINGGDIRKVVDPTLDGEFEINSAWKVVEIAMSCTKTPGIQRPDMSIVLAELKQCLAIQIGFKNLYGVRGNSTYSSITSGGACLDYESLSLVSAR